MCLHTDQELSHQWCTVFQNVKQTQKQFLKKEMGRNTALNEQARETKIWLLLTNEEGPVF